jgi:branched-chain amino acid transport system substrate-binding protein
MTPMLETEVPASAANAAGARRRWTDSKQQCCQLQQHRPDRRRPANSLGRVAAAAALATGLAIALGGCAINGGGSAASQLANPGITQPGAPAATQLPGRQAVKAKVALLLPLSAAGQSAVVAKAMKQAAELALFEHKDPGFQLAVKDTKGTPEGAAAAATEALAGGAEMIIGPLFAKSVSAVSPLAQKANVPVMAFSNDQRVAGNGTYLLSFMAQEEVRRIISFATSQGKRQFVGMVPDNDYGRLVETAFRAAVAEGGGIVVNVERYPPGLGGVLGPAHKVIEDIKVSEENGIQIDALFVPGGPDVLANLGPVIIQDKLDTSRVKLLGSGGWDYNGIGRHRAFIGGWYPAPDPRNWQAFSQKFSQTFGSAPPRVASLANNAVTIAIKLAATYGRGQRYAAANLTRSGGFVGADGIVRFRQSGLAERGLAVLEVQKTGSHVIAPAPQTFSDLTAGQLPARTGSISFN